MTTQRRTWEDYLSSLKHAVRPGPVYLCPNCGKARYAFAIFDQPDGTWVCGTCQAPPASGPPALTWDDVRGLRAVFLASTDWSQLADVPVATRLKWAPLRQRARDLPSTGSVAVALDGLKALRLEAALL